MLTATWHTSRTSDSIEDILPKCYTTSFKIRHKARSEVRPVRPYWPDLHATERPYGRQTDAQSPYSASSDRANRPQTFDIFPLIPIGNTYVEVFFQTVIRAIMTKSMQNAKSDGAEGYTAKRQNVGTVRG